MSRHAAAVFTAWLVMTPLSTEACSFAEDIVDRPDRVVMIARISGYTTVDRYGAEIHAVELKPVRIFQAPEPRLDVYRYFPRSLGPNCSLLYRLTNEGFESRFPIGSHVAVHSPLIDDHKPGALTGFLRDALIVLKPECTPQRIEEMRPDYEADAYRYQRIECGGLTFHAYKEIALLRDQPLEQRIEFVERFQTIRSHMRRYEEWVVDFLDLE